MHRDISAKSVAPGLLTSFTEEELFPSILKTFTILELTHVNMATVNIAIHFIVTLVTLDTLDTMALVTVCFVVQNSAKTKDIAIIIVNNFSLLDI